MKSFFAAMILMVALATHAAAPPHGADQLSALVVSPELKMTIKWELQCHNDEWMIDENPDVAEELAKQREIVKLQPENMEALMRLAYLLGSNGQTNDAVADYQTAEQFYRKKVAANPRDGASFMALGKAIDGQGKSDEAESIFRKATLISPNEWEGWAAFGTHLQNASLTALFSNDIRNMISPGQAPSPAVLAYRPTPAALERAEALRAEAIRCCDRALKLAPEEPRLYVQLAGLQGHANWENCYLRYYRDGDKITPEEWISAYLSKGIAANLKKAAELKPMDYQYTAMVAFFDCMIPMAQRSVQPTGGMSSLNGMPDDARQSIHQAMAQLENLAHGGDEKNEAGALEMLAILNMTMGNNQAVLDDCRRAVKLDPMRDGAWDLLLIVLEKDPSPDASQITAACEARLKTRDSERNHVLFGHILAKLKKWDDAKAQAEIAEAMDTNDVVPPLMLAAIALRQGNQMNFLAEAKNDLEHANAVFGKNSTRAEAAERWRELMLNAAIFDVFINQPRQAASYAQTVLKQFPDDSVAPEILKYIVMN